MVRWRAQAARVSIGSCKTKPQRQRQPRRSGVPRSRGCRRSLREAVDAAIADGATIDEITALIRGEGGACSRSAVGRYTKNVRDLIRQQQEADRANEAWVRALGERVQGRAGLILIETLRTMTLTTLAELSNREKPPTPEELARLSLVSSASKAPTSSASSGSGRRRRQPGPRPARARRRSGRASRLRPSPLSARSSRAGPARPSAPSHRRRSTRGILRNPT